MNLESDCSILDSSIPPKGINEKQWTKSREDTVKLINSKNTRYKSALSSEGFNSSHHDNISDSLKSNSNDERISTTKQIKYKSKNVSANQNNAKNKTNKSTNSTKNHFNSNRADQNSVSDYQSNNSIQEKGKSSEIEEMYESSSINSVTIEEFQKDLWLKKSIKSVDLINSQKKQNYLITSTEEVSTLSNSDNLTGRKWQAKENEEHSEFSNASKSISEDSSELKSHSEDQNDFVNTVPKEKNNENDENQAIHVSVNRSGKINDNTDKSSDDTNKDNEKITTDYDNISIDDEDDNINKSNENTSMTNGNENKDDSIKENKYKNNIKWEIKQFNDIFDIDNTGLPIRIKSKKSPKHHSRNSKNHANSPRKRHKTLREKTIDSEVGQLELPSTTLFDLHPKLESSEMEIELNFFQSEDSKSPQSTSNESPIKYQNSTSPKNIRKKKQDKNNFASFNSNQMNFAIDIPSSDANGDLMFQFQKNAKLLSSPSNSEAEKHEDKTISKRGITLFLLSSSDSENPENDTKSNKTFTLNEIGQELSTTSSSISREAETEIKSLNQSKSSTSTPKKKSKRKSKSEVKSESNSDLSLGIEFEKKKIDDSTLSENNSNYTSSEKESTPTSSGKRRRREYLTASLTVVQAHGLPSLNVPRRDPYCFVSFKGSQEPHKTKVMRDTTSPIWNSKFSFGLKSVEDPLHFSVRYEDKFGGDIDVAEGEMNLKNVEIGKFNETWIRLRPVTNGIEKVDGGSSLSSLASACELYVTIILEQKKTSPRTPQQPTSPKTPQQLQQIQQSSFLSSSSRGKRPTPLNISPFSKIIRYEGELTMTITIVEAKNITSNLTNKISELGVYCAVNVVGRKDIRKTKTVFGTSSPIWDKQFKFTLANWKDSVGFSVRVEDKNRGDYVIAKKVVKVDEIPLNAFIDKWVSLGAANEIKRLPLRDSLFTKRSKKERKNDDDDLIGHDYSEFDDDVDVDENSEAGELHFTLVLEPRIKEVQVSPRPSPSPIGTNAFSDFGYPDSPMSYFIPKQSENEEN